TFHDKDEWMHAEDLPQIDLFFAQIWMRSFANDMEKSVGVNYRKVLGVYRNFRIDFYYGKEDCHKFTLAVINKIVGSRGDFGDEINKQIRFRSDALVAYSKKIHDSEVSKLSNKELWELYSGYSKVHTELYEYGWLSNATDMFYPEFTDKLKGYLRTITPDEDKVSAYFVMLTTPEEETIATQETRDFLALVSKIQAEDYLSRVFAEPFINLRQKIPPALREEIFLHWKRYKHLKFMYYGLEETEREYYAHLQEYLISGKSASDELTWMDEEKQAKRLERQKLFRELKTDPFHRRLFDIFAEFMVTKWYRRNAQILSLHYVECLLREIGDRFGLSLAQVRCVMHDEMELLLSEEKFDPEELKRRDEFSIQWFEKGSEYICTGEKARKIAAIAERKDIDYNLKELKGQCACLGYAKGKVKIIQGAKDLHKMEKGDILVAYATDPDVVPAMKKAAAIVTEQGGVTCHAAIVSREMGIPCVIGTKIATKVLKDGEMVEVDATRGIVRRL
ncbi:MAG: PEP-utilizing enzyme, partial [Candidatus Micrarchaeota archaeon]